MAMKINLSAVISFNQNVDPHSLYSIRLTVNIVTTSLDYVNVTKHITEVNGTKVTDLVHELYSLSWITSIL